MLYLLWEKDNWKTKLRSWLPTTIEDITAYNQKMNTKMQKIRDILQQPSYRKKIQNIANTIKSLHTTQQQQRQKNQNNDIKATITTVTAGATTTTNQPICNQSATTTTTTTDQQIPDQTATTATTTTSQQTSTKQHQSQFQTSSHLKGFMNLLKAVKDITRDQPKKFASLIFIELLSHTQISNSPESAS